MRGALFASVASAAVLSADAAWAQTRSFNVPAQPAGSGVAAFARQADVQILISAEHAAGRRTNAVVGELTIRSGLATLLQGTGLMVQNPAEGTYVVVPFQEEAGSHISVLPEILVQGGEGWSLNTSVRHTEDDAQPYQIFTQEDLRQSGAVSLEQFFRDNLGANVSPVSSEQTEQTRGRNQIRLRGLGTNETLILVDGRRLASVNTGAGFLEQPTIVGIPMAQIERIEVLPSSASSVYGGGATGGVINIIMKRDYRGAETTATYADVTDGEAPDYRFDFSGGLNLEDGRTNVSASVSYRDASPLRMADRDLVARGYRHILDAGSPYFDQNLVLGATPNIRSQTGAILTLDPAFGGASLGSNHTFAPYGFRGIGLDGVAPLVANAGMYNLDLAPNAQGAGQTLTTGQEALSGSIAVRREMTSWLRLYGEVQASETRSTSDFVRVPSLISLAANAPNNPFQQAITVAAPHIGADGEGESLSESRRYLAGAVAQLPFHWQGNLDYTYNWSQFTDNIRSPGPDLATLTAFRDGSVDVIRDINEAPLAYNYLDFGTLRNPAESTTETFSLRFAGPAPISLPGGRPSLSILFERTEQWIGDSELYQNTADSSVIQFTPERWQDTDSAYAEVWLPVIGPANGIPFVHEFGLGVSARYDKYESKGTLSGINCLNVSRPLTEAEIASACPPAGVPPVYQESTASRTDPTYSAKWAPFRDVAFRASYGTGYLPPYLHQLIKQPTPIHIVRVVDPERGDEPIGTALFPGFNILQGAGNFLGGNPDVLPERSETFSAGAIFTPRWIPDLRISVDWTRIEKRDNYFDPRTLLAPSAGDTEGQALFEAFLRQHPDRFTRGPAGGGFAVGPIIAADMSIANLAGSNVEAWDFAIEYSHDLWGGRLDLKADATHLSELSVQLSEETSLMDWSGVITGVFAGGFGSTGGLTWKGNSTVAWTNDTWSLGWRTRFFNDYYLRQDRTVHPLQGDDRVPSQIYHDLFATWELTADVDLRVGVNNVLDAAPPVDVSTGTFYSRFGDPRLRNFYLAVTRRF
ncbi:MAG: TonB-dependent receptor [Pseudomonadota bacterium]|nr:TonB-dependent receptor [Pseudomonadota bacterium]